MIRSRQIRRFAFVVAFAPLLAASGATGSSTVVAAEVVGAYVSPGGLDSNPCTQAAPCRSFDRAYRVAQPGQVVEVAGGWYGGQSIGVDGSKTSLADVVFRPAAGASVSLGDLKVSGKHVEIREMVLGGWSVEAGAGDVTFRDLDVNGGIFINGGDSISIIGGSVGPGVDYHPQFAPWPVGSPITNILIDGVEFHDWTRSNDSVHTECLQIAGGNGVTIRNSVFRNCAVMDLSITEYNGSGPPTDYLIENNVFGTSIGGYYSLQFNSNASALRDILIRNNSGTQEFLIDNAQPTISNVRVVANVAPIAPWNCSSRVTYSRNVWQGGACSPTDKNVSSLGFRNPGALDLHLATGSPAIDAGDAANYPVDDFDGESRYAGAAPDAGADETGAAPPPADTTPPSVPANLRKTASTTTSVTAAWDPATDNVGVTAYGVYRNGTSVGSTASLSYTLTGLACGTSYTLAVDAADAAGNRSAKAQITASTDACSDSVAPTVPTSLAETGSTASSIAVSWTASTDNVGVTAYGVYRNGTSVGSTASTSYSFSGLTCGTSYTLALDAADAAGNRSAKAQITASTDACPDSQAPTAPPGLAKTGSTASSITVSWTASTDNVGVTAYGVYRNGTSIGSAASTSYTYSGLTCNTTYTLAVDAVDAAGNRSAKAQITAGTSACPVLRVSTTGSDANACLSTSPCKTLGRAYDIAEPGQIVEVAAGTYAAQTIAVDSAKTSLTDVLIRPVSGAAVTLGGLTVQAKHLELRDMAVGAVSLTGTADDVTLRNLDAGAPFTIAGSQNVSVIGGSVGPGDNASPTITASGTTPPRNVLLDGVTFHDWRQTDGSSDVQCLRVQAADGLTIRNSRFRTCEFFSILLVGGTMAGSPKNVTIENNFLDCCRSGWYSIYLGDGNAEQWSDILIRNNSTNKNMGIANGAVTVANVRFFANVGPGLLVNIGATIETSSCVRTGVTTDWNVWSVGPKCGVNDLIAPSGYVDAANFDFHLTPGSAAIGRANTASLPATDIDGELRPLGGAADAGADESAATGGDTTAPSAPSGLAETADTQTSITVAWNASSDDVGVTGYGLYRNGTSVGSTASLSYTFTGLACGTSYTLAVDAVDAAGNRSAKAQITASTSACPDSVAPTAPTGLAETGSAASSITVSWTASSDNVGVTAYGVYRNGTSVGSTASLSYTFTGLACGTSYTLAVDAVDAAGNRSAKAQITASTAPCVVYVASTGSDANPCTQALKCKSFDRGYRVAVPGATVEVSAGTYPMQTINVDASKTSSTDVVIKPAAGATVTLTDDVVVNGSHVEVQGMTVGGITVNPGATDVTFRNLTDNGGLWIDRASDISIIGGTIGGGTDYTPTITSANGATTPPRNILIDGVEFRDWRSSSPGGNVQCLRVEAVDGLTIRNSKFRNCELFGILLISPTPAGSPTNVTIENNFLDCCAAGWYSIYLGDGNGERWQSITIRHNSTNKLMAIANGSTTVANVRFSSNVGPGLLVNIGATVETSSCVRTGVTTNWNVWSQGPKCGANDLIAPHGFVDAAGFDFHLVAGAAAINRGDPASYPATDIDGQSRPLGAAPDAGADENA